MKKTEFRKLVDSPFRFSTPHGLKQKTKIFPRRMRAMADQYFFSGFTRNF